MRVTQSMYYDSIYGNNNSKLNRELFDVNKQIASGLKIQYAKDDVRTFTETMRLDNEITVLEQIKTSTESGYKVANQTDQVLNEFTDSMNRMRTLLVQAANGTNDETSLDAIADELRGIEKNLKGLANTSINGQFLFSGSKVDTRPISDDGIYHGDNKAMNAFVGSRNQQQYNLTGADLFLGEEKLRSRELTSNVSNSNLLDNTALTPSSTLRELMGDKDEDENTVNTPYFYLRGTQSDGTTFKKKIDNLNSNNTVQDLLNEIGKAYGNIGSLDVVTVRLNEAGEIVVEDKLRGSSKLDFHMVGAIDYSNSGAANKTDIDDLDSGETTYPPTGNLYIKEFVKSGLEPASGAATNIEGLVYDRTKFEKSGTHLSSNVSQILKKTHLVTENGMIIDTISPEKENAFADPSTLLSEVADPKKEINPPTNPKTYTLDGSKLTLSGTDTAGNAFNVTINLKNSANGGSTFSPDNGATNYKIFNMNTDGRDAVDADEMTYQQLMDVMNMVVTGTYPATEDNENDYDKAIKEAELKGSTYLSYDGKIQFHDLQSSGTNGTQAEIALYDANSDDFSKEASVMTFNTNNALTVRDPKTDFFKTIDEMIAAVEDHKLYPDVSSGHLRNVGIENALAKMDDLQDHVFRMHSKIGAQSNTLSTAQERTEILRISTMSLRSSVVDTDLAESSLRLQQLTTNYQAMLST
ncbi:MAG: flagellar biosynthesis protein FlgL, partial [Sulfurimonas sp.]